MAEHPALILIAQAFQMAIWLTVTLGIIKCLLVIIINKFGITNTVKITIMEI